MAAEHLTVRVAAVDRSEVSMSSKVLSGFWRALVRATARSFVDERPELKFVTTENSSAAVHQYGIMTVIYRHDP